MVSLPQRPRVSGKGSRKHQVRRRCRDRTRKDTLRHGALRKPGRCQPGPEPSSAPLGERGHPTLAGPSSRAHVSTRSPAAAAVRRLGAPPRCPASSPSDARKKCCCLLGPLPHLDVGTPVTLEERRAKKQQQPRALKVRHLQQLLCNSRSSHNSSRALLMCMPPIAGNLVPSDMDLTNTSRTGCSHARNIMV